MRSRFGSGSGHPNRVKTNREFAHFKHRSQLLVWRLILLISSSTCWRPPAGSASSKILKPFSYMPKSGWGEKGFAEYYWLRGIWICIGFDEYLGGRFQHPHRSNRLVMVNGTHLSHVVEDDLPLQDLDAGDVFHATPSTRPI